MKKPFPLADRVMQRACQLMTKVPLGTRVARRLMATLSKRGRWIGQSPDGFQFILGDNRFVEWRIYLYGVWEREIRDFLHGALGPGMVFVDAGTNIGCFSMQ